MNFNRQSQREDLLFALVLLLPPVFVSARGAESGHLIAHISQARSEAATAAARTRAPERFVVRGR
jgi:hypothetical protein